MKRAMLWLSALLALCLMMGAAALAEEDAVVSAPVDVPVEEIEAEIWTDDIAADVAEYEDKAVAEADDFLIEDGVLTKYRGSDEYVTVPDGVTEIGYCAFASNQKVKSVVLPDSVEVLSYEAFAFSHYLEHVTLSKNLKEIRDSVFYRCNRLESIDFPQGLTYIGSNAFEECASLTSISIPNSVTYIGIFAFRSCQNLTNITLTGGTAILDYTFSACTSLTHVVIPEGVTTLKDTFAGCSNLTSVVLPASVTALNGAFMNSGLTSFVVPATVTDISAAFCECAALKSVVVPRSVTKMSSAFSGCTSLTIVNIPDSVTELDWTFAGCTSLTHIDIPDSVTVIEGLSFQNCTGLTTIQIPDGVTLIGIGAFGGCTGLTSVEIPDGVTSILYHAFAGCTGIRHITIPAGVSVIENEAFEGCSSLADVYIRANGEINYGLGVFQNCDDQLIVRTLCETPATQWARAQGYHVVTTPHELIVDAAVMPTCTQDGLSEATFCVVCGQYTVAPEVIPALGHDKVTDPAVKPTLTRTGLTEGSHCARCGEVLVAQQVVPKLVALSKCTVAAIDDKAYTGKAIKPAPVVKRGTKTLKKGTDYTVAYANNTAVGKATVTIKGKGAYTGTVKKTFRILPKKVALSSLTAGKGKLTVKWTKSAGAGYQIQYSLKSDFSTKKTVTIAKAGTIRTTLKNLKSGKNYYVRIRGYRLVGGKAYASAWSKAKKNKVK